MVDFKTNPLVTTEWLADNLSSPDLRVVDGSYYLPNEEIDARAKYEEQHIPGAVFFDIDDISDTTSPLPHMVPPPHKFSSRVRKLGLGDGLRYVIYDQRGIFSAPRVWWTFRYFGHVSTILYPTVEDLRAKPKPLQKGLVQYGRAGTPTAFALEDAVAELEGAYGGITMPSGLAAICGALLALTKSGDHILISDSAYYPTRAFCDNVLNRYGVTVTYYDPRIGSGITDLIRPDTRVVFTESPGSQTFEIQDVPAIAEAAHGLCRYRPLARRRLGPFLSAHWYE